MKKYITTDKHPELKKGIIFNHEDERSSYCLHSCDESENIYIEQHVKNGLANGYIKELQEPEFTKDDMIDFCIWYTEQINSEKAHCFPDNNVKAWLKDRSK